MGAGDGEALFVDGFNLGASHVWVEGLTVRNQAYAQTCIPTMDVPGDSPTTVPPQYLTLAAGCPAIDAGAILPNINDGFLGSAPDLGAYEKGQPLPTYGPRPDAASPGDDDDCDGDNDGGRRR